MSEDGMTTNPVTSDPQRIGVIGLGYVGLTEAVEFARVGFAVTGFEINEERVRSVQAGHSYVVDVSSEELRTIVASGALRATSDFDGLADMDAILICVPTPLGKTKAPDLSYIAEAVRAIRQRLRRGQLVVLESTTYPGTTSEVVLPELVDLAREVGGADHRFRVIQLPYNLAMPEAFTRANQKLDGVFVSALEAARRLDVYVMASASVYQGQLARGLPPVVTEYLPGLTSDAQRAIQFVRSTPGIGTALVGMKTPAHVDENLDAATTVPMPWEQFKRLFNEA